MPRTSSKTKSDKKVKVNTNINVPFESKLFLFRYFLLLFNCERITDDKIKILNSVEYEGIDEYTNQTKFYEYLKELVDKTHRSKLKDYDDNIIEYLEHINRKRTLKISLKYFQYLSILFTEFYLDSYFNDKIGLIDTLNKFTNNIVKDINFDNVNSEDGNVYSDSNVNKLAYMSATGSGKTIILHINILQMLKYNKNFSKHSNVLLLTKNERLSNQHKEELDLSDIKASIFNEQYSDSIIQIIDINKIKDQDGPGTYCYENFGNDNLLFVDEGHSGTSGDTWLNYRKDLVKTGGFTFEYSATFKEAVEGKDCLEEEYQRAIIFDYQYLYFRNDGYGKDYQILNLEKAVDEKDNDLYLTGCLLTYFEQLMYYSVNKESIKDFLIEKPLMVFVGTTVTGGSKSKKADSKVENTDVERVVLFLESFVRNNKSETIKNIVKILKGKTGITELNKTVKNKDLFENKFNILKEQYNYAHDAMDAAKSIYKDILKLVFNYELATDKPHIILISIKSDDEEIGISIGNSDKEFAVISVGEPGDLLELLKDKKINANRKIKKSKTLFGTIGSKDSSINILIGSKKFIEGWNNYRVSTMGLINFAKAKGVEAIQLFGRGVRLKGYKNSLKRSSCLDNIYKRVLKVPKDLKIVETLNIFGLSSDYMAKFRNFLHENGLSDNDNEIVVKKVCVSKTFDDIRKRKLKVLKVKDGMSFDKDANSFTFDIINDSGFYEYIKKDLNKIKKTYMNTVEIDSSNGTTLIGSDNTTNNYHISDFLIGGSENEYASRFVDYDNVYYDLVNYKKLKSYNKIIITKEAVKNVIENTEWYYIVIDEGKIIVNGKDDIDRINRILCDLLRALLDKYYKYKIKEWESYNLEYQDIDEKDENFFDEYEIYFEKNQAAIDNKLGEKIDVYIDEITKAIKSIKEVVNPTKKKGGLNNIKGNFIGKELKVSGIENCFAVLCPEHLYEPLYSLGKVQEYNFSIKPVALNIDEKKFVELLLKYLNDQDNGINYYKKFLEENTEVIGKNAEIYLLRNMPKKGIGFFEASNFYPDFILWVDTDTTQYINFIDPKGIRNLANEEAKYKFCSNEVDGDYKTIKDLQFKLSKQLTNKDKKIVLNAFILSNTKKSELGKDVSDNFENYNVIFMYNDNDDKKDGNIECIVKMFNKMVDE